MDRLVYNLSTPYIDAVTAENTLQDEDNILLSRAFYCSWNYGVFHDMNEAKLLKTARFVAANMPEVKHFLIDGAPYFLVNIISFAAIAVILSTIDWQLTILVLIPVPFLVGGGRWLKTYGSMVFMPCSNGRKYGDGLTRQNRLGRVSTGCKRLRPISGAGL